MLAQLKSETPARFVDWFSIERVDGRDVDVGMHRHWRDPMVPFVEHVVGQAHGVLVTSATLRDSTADAEADWRAAETRTGASHLARPAIRAAVPSPFDYATQPTRQDCRNRGLAGSAIRTRTLFKIAETLGRFQFE